VNNRSGNNTAFVFFNNKGWSSEILIVNIRQHINKIIDKWEEHTPHLTADFESLQPQIKMAFADLFKPPMGVTLAYTNNVHIDNSPLAKTVNGLPYRMSDLKPIQFETEIAEQEAYS
jgi:hypothetical protein